MVGDCRRNLVGRCAESSLVCPRKGKRGTDFYLLCLTTKSFTYLSARVSTPVAALDEIETKVNGGGCATDAKYHAVYLAGSVSRFGGPGG